MARPGDRSRTLFNEFNSCEADAAAGQESVAIRDGRIAVAYAVISAFGGGVIQLIRTSNDFATFTDDTIASASTVNAAHHVHQVGFVTVSGNRKLAGVFQRGFDTIRYRRQL